MHQPFTNNDYINLTEQNLPSVHIQQNPKHTSTLIRNQLNTNPHNQPPPSSVFQVKLAYRQNILQNHPQNASTIIKSDQIHLLLYYAHN